MHPLEGPRLRVIRAKQQIKTLERLMNEFCNSHYYEAIGAEIDPKTGKQALRIYGVEQPPVEWGIDIGEIAHNLRAALDGMTWQLALLKNPHPSQLTQFPVFLRGHTIRRRKARKGKGAPLPSFWGTERGDGIGGHIKSLHPCHQAALERFQPYKRGNGRTRSPVYLLHEINNADKHRLIQVVALRTIAATFGSVGARDASYDDIRFDLRYRRPLKDGAKVGDGDPAFIKHVDMAPQVVPAIAFGEGCDAAQGLLVGQHLRKIAAHVEDIVESFSPEFS